MSYTIRCSTRLDHPWLWREPIRIGRVPPHLPEPARYLLVSRDEKPVLRVDAYDDHGGCDNGSAEAAQETHGLVDRFLVAVSDRGFAIIDVTAGRVVGGIETGLHREAAAHQADGSVVVRVNERLYGVDRRGEVAWTFPRIDALEVLAVSGQVVTVREWDPRDPGPREIRLSCETGEVL
jgi:hypothetical protein